MAGQPQWARPRRECTSMKAARWVDMGRVVCEDVPVPSVADGQVLLRTAYASICGSDLHSVFLNAPPEPGPAGYPGHESVGEVVESRSPGFAPGDCVLTVPHAIDGRCLAEYQALPGAACIRLPGTAPLSHLLMAQQLGTVVYALRYHPLDLVGKDVAVIGQGSAGAFFTFLLRRAGGRRGRGGGRQPGDVPAEPGGGRARRDAHLVRPARRSRPLPVLVPRL